MGLNGSVEHPLYYKKKGSLIFETTDEISQALEKYLQGDKSIGNHDDCLYLFDSFSDDNGRKRAGYIISRLFLNLTIIWN